MTGIKCCDYYPDNNLKQVAYANSAVATPGVAFTYDTNYNRLMTMTDGIGTTTYAYHPVASPPGLGAGRLASVDGPLANDTVTYAYDALGRITNRAIDGVAQTAAFDALGRVTVVTNALGAFTNTYAGVTSRVTTNFFPNGQKTVFGYCAATNDFRLQEIRHWSGSNQLSAFAYTYDAAGQIETWTRQADADTPQVWVMDYDPASQLLGVTVRSNSAAGLILKQFVYGYDQAGNRYGESIRTASTSSLAAASFNQLNQLTALAGGGPVRFSGSLSEPGAVRVGGSPARFDLQTSNFTGVVQASLGTNVVPVIAADFKNNRATNYYQLVVTNSGVSQTLSYDLNGNLVSAVSSSVTNLYEWDAANRLVLLTQIAANQPVLASEFAYDGLGRRVRIVEKTNDVAQSDRRFLWCELELCEERDASGGTVVRRFFGEGEQIAGTNYYFTTDHLGSVREVTDTGGALRARYDYDPYGSRHKISGDLDCSFGFTGHYFHAPSGLCLTLFRAYSPGNGRWLSRDPIEERGGNNVYGFVHNTPLNAIDPDGGFAIPWWLPPAAVGAVAISLIYLAYRGLRSLSCHNDIRLEFARAEGEAHRNAPDDTSHRQTSAGANAVMGGDADALTHCIASCNLGKNPPPGCNGVDDVYNRIQARETQYRVEDQVDRMNNFEGISIGRRSPNNCTHECLGALRNRKLWEVTDGRIRRSSVDSVGDDRGQ